MNDWIDFDALWKIVVIGLAAGAGLPAIFAVGLKALSLGQHDSAVGAAAGGGSATATVTRNPMAVAAAGLCFAVVLAAIGWGIYLIVAGT